MTPLCSARDPGRYRKLQLRPARRSRCATHRVEARTPCRIVHRSHHRRRYARLLRRHREYRSAPRTSVSRRRGIVSEAVAKDPETEAALADRERLEETALLRGVSAPVRFVRIAIGA